MGLRLRRRQGGRPRQFAQSPRRQRCGLSRNGPSRPAGAARLHHHHRGLQPFLRQRQSLPEGFEGAGRCRAGRGRPHHRQEIRRRRKSAAGLSTLRRARLDAGHDGYRAQSRAQRRHRRSACGEIPRPALCLGQLPALHHHVWQCGARHRASSFRGNPRRPQGPQRLHAGHRSQRRRLGQYHRPLQGARRGGKRQAVPARSARAIVGRHRRGVRLVDEPARHHLSPPAQYSGELGHRGQCAGHGVRQYGRDFGHRRRLHAQSLDRREEALRRILDQCARRRRRCRHPHAAGDHRASAQGSRFAKAVDGIGDAGGLRRALPHPRRAGAALPRHAGSRIHRRAGQAVDAADAQRQAHGACGAAHCGRARQREIDHQGRGSGADRSLSPRSAFTSDHRSQCRTQSAGHRASCFPWRRLRRDRLFLRGCRDAEESGPQGDPGAHRDFA